MWQHVGSTAATGVVPASSDSVRRGSETNAPSSPFATRIVNSAPAARSACQPSCRRHTPASEPRHRCHEAVVRFSDVNSGTAELGDLRIFGLGLRSDVTRYLDEDLPVRVAFMCAYRSVEFADGLTDATLWTAGLQVGRRFGRASRWAAGSPCRWRT